MTKESTSAPEEKQVGVTAKRAAAKRGAAKTAVAPVKKAAAPARTSAAKTPAAKTPSAKTPSAKTAAAKPAPAARASAAPKAKAEPEQKEKAKKAKLVRDSFTMPEAEYAALGEVKKACLKAGIEVKKSELLRIGVALVRQLDTARLKEVLAGLPTLKTGRPKKSK